MSGGKDRIKDEPIVCMSVWQMLVCISNRVPSHQRDRPMSCFQAHLFAQRARLMTRVVTQVTQVLEGLWVVLAVFS